MLVRSLKLTPKSVSINRHQERIPLYVSALIIHDIKDGLDLLDICLELCIAVPALEVP